MSLACVVLKEFHQATLLVASADTPDCGPVAFQAVGQIAHTLAGGNSQNETGMLHLEPRQTATVSDELQDWLIRWRDRQRTGFATTHEDASDKGAYPQDNP
jgi:hypothetical protein